MGLPRAVLASATALVVLVGCPVSTAPAGAQGAILISIDTLRPDHLGCYGYDRATSPQIDRFRRDGILFEQTIAHAPSTLASHASILTSALPQHHRASHGLKTALSREYPTLAELLKAHDYDTASFNGGAQLDPIYGLNFLFSGGPPPPPPSGDCGRDSTTPLSCESYDACR